jgi:phosphoserine phosphatase
LDNAETGTNNPRGLVVFDVEGVLLPKRRYIIFEATRKLGFIKFLKIILLGLLYETGLLSLETALKRIFTYFKGHTIHELRHYYEAMPLLPHTEQVFEHLHQHGWKTALISSGLPNMFIQELAAKLKADHAVGVRLITANDKFIGQIAGDVITTNGKATVLTQILNREHLTPENCILVADDRNNLQMFPHATLTIGYHPDFILTAKSDHIITGNLTEILPLITKTKPAKPKSTLSRNQIIRATIHLSGFTVPFLCTYLLNRHLAALLISLTTLLYIISELTRIMGRTFPILTAITAQAAVKLEPYEFATAPIFYALGIILALTIFPPAAGYASIAILTLGDGAATLFGKKLGKTRFPFNKAKNLEGSILGFTLAFLGATLFIDPIRALIGAAAGMLTECLPTPINDNLIIPLTAGIILTLTLV